MDLKGENSPLETYDVDLGVEHATRYFQKDISRMEELCRLSPYDDNGRLRRDVIQARCLRSTEAYIKTLLWIRPKEGDDQFGRQPRLMNEWKPLQQKLYNLLKTRRQQSKPMWVILLKARQQGASTMTAATLYARCATRFYERMLVVGHSDKNAAELLEMYKTFHTYLPAWMRPLTRAENRNELLFQNPSSRLRSQEPGLGGRISIDTARDSDAGAGYTVTGFHGSEVARNGWSNASALFATLNQAMPQPHVNPNTIQILESTAEGQQGWFYDTWNRSVEGNSPYVPLFVGFWEEPTYCLDPPEEYIGLTGKQIRADLTEREVQLIDGCKERYGHEITDGQLAWRRWMIPKYCENDPELFDNQYPWSPEVAFRSSGVTVFAPTGHASAKATIRPPSLGAEMTAPLQPNPESWRLKQPEVTPVPSGTGGVNIYAIPEYGWDVVAVHDPSDGYPDSDMQASQFFAFRDNCRPEQIATIECRRPLHEYVDQAYLLGRFCEEKTGRRVLHIPEANKEGTFTTSRLLSYGSLVHIRENAQKVKGLLENKYGFLLTKSNKPKARTALARVIATQAWIFHDKHTLDQIQNYVVVNRPDGSIEYEGAPRGIKPGDHRIRMRRKLYDDLVDACMILAYVEMDVLQTLDQANNEGKSADVDAALDRIVGSMQYSGRKALNPYGEAHNKDWRN